LVLVDTDGISAGYAQYNGYGATPDPDTGLVYLEDQPGLMAQ
jgi:hypothetical protein